MPYRKRTKPLRGTGVAAGAMCPIRPNVVWALDFQFDQTADGRQLKLLNVIDEHSRQCLVIDVDRSIDADGVVRCLERIALQRGAPKYVPLTLIEARILLEDWRIDYNLNRPHSAQGGLSPTECIQAWSNNS